MNNVHGIRESRPRSGHLTGEAFQLFVLVLVAKAFPAAAEHRCEGLQNLLARLTSKKAASFSTSLSSITALSLARRGRCLGLSDPPARLGEGIEGDSKDDNDADNTRGVRETRNLI